MLSASTAPSTTPASTKSATASTKSAITASTKSAITTTSTGSGSGSDNGNGGGGASESTSTLVAGMVLLDPWLFPCDTECFGTTDRPQQQHTLSTLSMSI